MYITMNRFYVRPGLEAPFVEMWRARRSLLPEVPGYIEFHMLKGPPGDDHSLFASHTVWRSVEDFSAWTTSEPFRRAHARAGQSSGNAELVSRQRFEGFEVVIHEDARGTRRVDPSA